MICASIKIFYIPILFRRISEIVFYVYKLYYMGYLLLRNMCHRDRYKLILLCVLESKNFNYLTLIRSYSRVSRYTCD